MTVKELIDHLGKLPKECAICEVVLVQSHGEGYHNDFRIVSEPWKDLFGCVRISISDETRSIDASEGKGRE